MRLFFAVGFSEAEKNVISENVASLKKMCVRGNFTRRENLHITLAFLGEVDRASLKSVIEAAARVDFSPFDIAVGGAGKFGNIVWLGVGGDEIKPLAAHLRASLDKSGIYYDRKPFSPHLTLCREAEFQPGCDAESFNAAVRSFDKRVVSFDLMESTRVDGRLVYKKLYTRKF